MLGEEQKLKKKINGLIEYIKGLENSVENQDRYIQVLKEQVRFLKSEEEGSSEVRFLKGEEEGESSEAGEIFAFMHDFCVITRFIIMKKDYIPYNYETKNSAHYYKVAQNIFEGYICNYAKLDLKKFLEFCVELGLVKAEKNKKCLYPSGSIRVYYISRIFMDAAARDINSRLQSREA